MIPCPSCQQPVEILDKHLGTLFTCPHCNAVYFIDWNGQPEMAEHESEPAQEPEIQSGTDFEGGADFQAGTSFENPTPQDFNAYGEAPVEVPQDYSATSEPTVYQGQIPQEVPEENAPQEDPYLTPADEIPPGTEIEVPGEGYQSSEQSYAAAAEVGQEAFAAPVEEAPYDFSQTLDRTPQPITNVATPDTPDFSDVTEFGNADTLAGPMTYAVIIDGIESSHLVMQLKEAMTDSRFGWDVNELLNQIGQGRLVLKGLSPAKASVLINRIKYLPFKISWRQDVLSGS
ncbi:MAG: hypothetical protein OM95_14520 [Bdellovibrio sp. ArHS]|uniref:zf-TFIIB domain-containing protein n=1 Tax=Bdellovibrio sp. ArHS TaxID=1569284 RepID=UPI000582942F|nr:zf-TFIIB domain-containing protein [Bdellovibrio sp. ArHS]KHD87402.1 MAG: hypothetical protein OM95_14520 [Bdellovibrio sp. ArHS]